MADVKRVYTFGNKEAEGNGKMRELLGGKGANLAEMNLIGIPVPPGFTITTEVCAEYYAHGKEAVIKIAAIISDSLWLIYTIAVHSYSGALTNVLLIVTPFGSLLVGRKRDNAK